MRNLTPILLLPAIIALIATGQVRAAGSLDRDERLRAVREEISRLEGDLAGLRKREQGVLGQVEQLGAELRLREAELREVDLRLDLVSSEIEKRQQNLRQLEGAQSDRRGYLRFRLRELYKAGPDQTLRRFVGGTGVEDYWGGLRYAAFLSDRDLRVIRGFRDDRDRLVEENRQLAGQSRELGGLEESLEGKRSAIRSGRSRRERLLVEIREDQGQRETAIEELRQAALELTRVVDDAETPGGAGQLDIRKFRGLLDWPASGAVTQGFGNVIHPKFQTRVPHPGLDIDGEFGADITNVFEGTVVFASWMRGYGLTAIVDHGGGLLSIYAHASVLLVEHGERCSRGQVLGKVGDSGSLRGPYLYFELRVGGEPIDPLDWLRRR